jgi:ankyrin repeat protein
MLAGVMKSGFIYSESDINVKDPDGNSALYYAAGHGNLQFCEFLL